MLKLLLSTSGGAHCGLQAKQTQVEPSEHEADLGVCSELKVYV